MDKVKLFFKNTFTMRNLIRFYFSFIWLGVILFGLDLMSKWLVKTGLGYEGNYITLIPNFLQFKLIFNNGASFGIGSSGDIGWKIFWLVISVVMSVALVWYYVKKYKTLRTWVKVALILMITGAIGNLIDRAFYWEPIVGFSGVIDFISFSFFPPVFNIADSCLVVGVIILLIILIIDSIKEMKEKDKRGDYELKPQDLEKKLKEENEKNSSEGK